MREDCACVLCQSAAPRLVQESVVKGAVVRTDSWGDYDELTKLGHAHEPMVQDRDGAKIDAHLPMIHIAFSNLRAWLMRAHHGVSQQHLPTYLNEFVFRFNRRFYPMPAFASVLGICVNLVGPTYRGLYDGTWDHGVQPNKAKPTYRWRVGVPTG
jgi:transposase-like protein